MCDCSREQVGDLIEVNREHPALWDVKHKDHKNRLILQNSYETMEESLKENMPSITVDRASRAGAELPTSYTSTVAEFYYSAGSERSEF